MPGALSRAAAFCLLLALPVLPAVAGERHGLSRHGVSLYGGIAVPSKFTGLFSEPFDTEFDDTFLFAAAYSYRIATIWDHLDLELEANIGLRSGDGGEVGEFNGAFVIRWDNFPWNDYVYTTLGLAVFGPSYATKITDQEREKSKNGKGSKFLNYFAPEITFAHPDDPDNQAFIRVHHRSGVFGLIDGVSGGSNFLTFGLRFRF